GTRSYIVPNSGHPDASLASGSSHGPRKTKNDHLTLSMNSAGAAGWDGTRQRIAYECDTKKIGRLWELFDAILSIMFFSLYIWVVIEISLFVME
ncbi:1822_t:CDS:2, partial [Acaulospora colombiana]